MSKISLFWDTVVKPAAMKCLDPNVMKALNESIPAEERDKLVKGFVDPLAQYFISQVIWRVEHDLADDRVILCVPDVLQVHDTLTDKDYWDHVWRDRGHKEGSTEETNLRDIATKLGSFLELLGSESSS